MTYDYQKSPSRLNIVSFLLAVGAAVGIYLGVKFIPVYWQARQVDEVLDTYAVQVSGFNQASEARDKLGEGIVQKATAELHAMGIADQTDQPLEIWFAPDYSQIEAKYEVIVNHPFWGYVKPTVMVMHRKRKVPL
jgi:hypothetical protein